MREKARPLVRFQEVVTSMSLEFMKQFGGRRIENGFSPPEFFDDTTDRDDDQQDFPPTLNFECEPDDWRAINPLLPESWRVYDWRERPVRFVDGKDAGQTIAWLNGTRGYLVPLRLAEIGSVVMSAENGELRREFAVVERVVAMDTSAFPWEEIESFAVALRKAQLRLLPTKQLPSDQTYDFARLTKAARRRTNYEMSLLEELAIAQKNEIPTVVDGPLKSHESGFDATTSPVFGVVKTYRITHLHTQGQQLLYQLEAGQRTPAFSFEYDTSAREEGRRSRLPIVAWYLRLSGGDGAMPNVGTVRVEVSRKWFEAHSYGADHVTARGVEFVNQLSRTLYEYRCRESSYRRATISLHPIVRAEESLGALFGSHEQLRNHFYCLTGL
jgi:hypothetical protein